MNQPRNANLVDHLGKLASARLPNAGEGARKSHGHRTSAVEVGLTPPHHDRKQAVYSARLATGHRRINKTHAQGLGLGGEVACDLGRGGGVVDKKAALGHAGKGALGAKDDATKVVIVTNAAKDDICLLSGLGGGRRSRSTKLGNPGLGLLGRSVVDRHAMASLCKVTRHGKSHNSKA